MHYITWKIDSNLRLIGGPHAGDHISALFPSLPRDSSLWDAIQEALGGVASVRNFSWSHTTWRVSAWPDASGQTVRGNCAPLMRAPADPRLQHEALVQQAALARHINHDMNGLLGSVLNYAELAEQQIADGLAPRDELKHIRAATLKMIAQISELRSLTASSFSRRTPMPIYAWLQHTVAALHKTHLHHTILLDLQSPDPGMIPVLEEPLRAALEALLENAWSATPSGGTIRLTARHLAAGAPELRGWPQLVAGEHLLLSVTDPGQGMRAEVLARATEPFYSTEHTQRGLGLSRVLGCAHQHGGAFNLESALGAGTTVSLTLPLHPPADRPSPPSPLRAAQGMPSLSSRPALVSEPHFSSKPPIRARVLLADDTEMVRAATRRVLERSHHTVTEAMDGHSALQLFLRAPDSFDIAVLDAEMPGDGLLIAEKLRALRPTLPILIVTGHHLPRSTWPVIEKPYNPTLLLSSVQQLLR